MTQTYRRKRNRKRWHFCANCHHWPESDYKSTTEKPKSTEICDQCKAKRFNDDCKSFITTVRFEQKVAEPAKQA